jgi:hypothetical protein
MHQSQQKALVDVGIAQEEATLAQNLSVSAATRPHRVHR